MSSLAFAREGRVAVAGGDIWFGVCGDLAGNAVPLLVIHGGPGMNHQYLAPLAALAGERPVIFYDQLDAGRADRPGDPANWRVERFVDEVDHLRRALGLERLDVFGNSWGGTLAAAYAAGQPAGLRKLVLSSPLLNTDRWIADNAAYRAALPAEVVAVMDDHEARGDTGAQAYLDAVDVFYARHFCRRQPWPDYVNATFETLDEPSYGGMWGPNEFTCTGVLQGYDGTEALPRITAATLITCGDHDEATPAACRSFAAMIPGAEVAVFEDASHLTFVEHPQAYCARLTAFLA